MTRSKTTKVNEWKSRKQNQQPHGEIRSLEEISDAYDAEHGQSKPK